MTQGSSDGSSSRLTTKTAVTAVMAVGLLVGLGAASNRLLDLAGIADEGGLTVAQQKEKARVNQEEYDKLNAGAKRSSWFSKPKANEMCADAGIVETAKKLINDQTPNFGRLGDTLQKLDAQRGGGKPDILADREKNLRDIKDYYARNPVDPNDKSMGDQNEARAKRLADLEAELAPLRVQAQKQRRASEQMKNAVNEIVVASEPIPIKFDPDLNRAACKLNYKVRGLGYDSPMMQITAPGTAVFTVQPGQSGWVVELLDLS